MIRRRTRPARAHTLIELTLAIAILTIGLFTVICSLGNSSVLVTDNQEYAIAYNAIRQKIEEMRGYYRVAPGTFSGANGIFSHYKSGLAANTFTVNGLTLLAGQTTQGSIVFPTNSATGALYEKYAGTYAADMGIPLGGLDLDGDGSIDNTDISLTYTLLPVTVVIQWKGAPGAQRAVWASTMIVNK